MRYKILAAINQRQEVGLNDMQKLTQERQFRTFRDAFKKLVKLAGSANKVATLTTQIGTLKKIVPLLDRPGMYIQEKSELNAIIAARYKPETTDGMDIQCPASHPTAVHSDFVAHLRILDSLCEFHSLASTDLNNTTQLNRLASVSKSLGMEIVAGTFTHDELNRLSWNLFQVGLPQDLITFVDTQLSRLSQNVENLLLNVWQDILSGKQNVDMASLKAAPLFIPRFSDKALQLITIVHDALFPGAPTELSVESKYLGVILALNRIRVTPHCLDIMMCEAPTHYNLNERVLLLPPTVQGALNPILGKIQSNRAKAHDLNKQRWQYAEYRMMEIIEFVVGRTPLTDDQQTRLTTLLQQQQQDWMNTCSVGVDLQALDLKAAVMAVFTTNKNESIVVEQEKLHTQLVPTIQFRLQHSLRTVLPEIFATDVHHLNHLMRLIYSEKKLTIPKQLEDPEQAGMQHVLDVRKTELIAKFEDPLWLFEGVVGIFQERGDVSASITDIQIRLDSKVLSEASTLNMQEIRLALLESSIGHQSEYFLNQIQTNPEHIRELHKDLGGHGLLGVAARAGNEAVFVAIVNQFSSSAFWHERDALGYTLLDYATLGGNTNIFTHVYDSMSEQNFSRAIDQSSQNPKTPSLVALAAESQNPAMIQAVTHHLSSDQITTMLITQDSRGYTALMHAAASGKCELLEEVYTLNPDKTRETANMLNNDGQSSLVLAMTHGKSPDAVRWLLNHGADPNVAVQNADGSVGLSALEVALIEGNIEQIHAILYDPRTLLVPDTLEQYLGILPDILTTLNSAKRIEILGLYWKNPETHRSCTLAALLALEEWPVKMSFMRLLNEVSLEEKITILNFKNELNTSVAVNLAMTCPRQFATLLRESGMDNDRIITFLNYECSLGERILSYVCSIRSANEGIELLTRFNFDQRKELLNVVNAAGGKIAFTLASFSSNFIKLLNDLSFDQKMKIFSLRSDPLNGNLIYTLMLGKNIKAFMSLLDTMSIEEKMKVLYLKTNSRGTIFAINLAHLNPTEFLGLLSKMEPDHIERIMSLVDAADKYPVAGSLAFKCPKEFIRLLQTLPMDNQLKILSLKNLSGINIIYVLAEYNSQFLFFKNANGDPLIKLFLMDTSTSRKLHFALFEFLTSEEEMRAFLLKDSKDQTLIEWIADTRFILFINILTSLQVDEKTRLLSVEDKHGNWLINKLTIEKLTKLKNQQNKTDLLSCRYPNGRSLAVELASEETVSHDVIAILRPMQANHIAEILSLKEPFGLCVAEALAIHRPIECMSLLEQLSDQQKIRVVTTGNNNIAAIDLASDWRSAGSLIRLLNEQPTHAKEILSYKNNQGKSVAVELARTAAQCDSYGDYAISTEFLQLLSLTDINGDILAIRLYNEKKDVFTEMPEALGFPNSDVLWNLVPGSEPCPATRKRKSSEAFVGNRRISKAGKSSPVLNGDCNQCII